MYRTDEKGTIIASSDGSKVIFNTQPGSYNGFATSNEKSEEISYDNQPSSDKNTINEGTIGNTAQVALSAKPSRIVYWTPNGKSYHYDKNCSTLSRSKVIIQGEFSTVPKSDPCDVCVN
ncbi:hypothetical protein [Clostridium sp.]|uniref:hypothetical protein n=1 Tax=Clostridium sp. TaxID=1506 RepID=UPI002FC78865